MISYKESWEYLKKIKHSILAVFLLFLFSSLLGYFFPVFFKEYIQNFISQLIEKTEGMGFLQLFFYILKNNITTSFFGMLFGIFFLIPLILTFFNGYVIGFVSKMVVGVGGFSVLLRLLPHGIFELPALFVSLGLGLNLGLSLFSKKESLKNNLESSLKVFLFVVIPLLVVAGLIETSLIFFLG